MGGLVKSKDSDESPCWAMGTDACAVLVEIGTVEELKEKVVDLVHVMVAGTSSKGVE